MGGGSGWLSSCAGAVTVADGTLSGCAAGIDDAAGFGGSGFEKRPAHPPAFLLGGAAVDAGFGSSVFNDDNES